MLDPKFKKVNKVNRRTSQLAKTPNLVEKLPLFRKVILLLGVIEKKSRKNRE